MKKSTKQAVNKSLTPEEKAIQILKQDVSCI